MLENPGWETGSRVRTGLGVLGEEGLGELGSLGWWGWGNWRITSRKLRVGPGQDWGYWEDQGGALEWALTGESELELLGHVAGGGLGKRRWENWEGLRVPQSSFQCWGYAWGGLGGALALPRAGETLEPHLGLGDTAQNP